MNRLFFFCLLTSLLFSVQAKGRYKIIAYVSGAGAPIKADEKLAKELTHINYTFANVIDGEIASDVTRPNDAANLATLNGLKQVNKNLKVLISIGGEQWSKGFSEAVKSDTAREKFALSIIRFITLHKIDGVELHWVFKPLGMYENAFNRTDMHNYALFIQLLREKLDAQSVADQRSKKDKYVLSMMGSSQRNYLPFSELGKIYPALDFINVQTFNYEYIIANAAGVFHVTTAGHHANLFESRADPTFKFCVDQTIKEYREFKIPSRKLVMGIPLYNYGWTQVYEEGNGLYQRAEASIPGTISYDDTKAYLDSTHLKPIWDKAAKAHYIFNSKTATFITCESPKAIRKKTQYIRNKKLAGAVCREYGKDVHHDLLKRVSKGLRGPALPSFTRKSYKVKNPGINRRQERRRIKEYNES
jgi:chitinase